MADVSLDDTIRNIDARLTGVEQFLPALATREELHTAIAPLATRAELHEAIAPLATRAELHEAVAPLATREEMRAAIAAAIAAAVAPLATREEVRADGEQARRHATMLFEDLRDDNRIILEHLLALSARVDALARR
jgi:hypothetical protein